MIAITIEHISPFMKKMLLQETFDTFLVSEADITTFISYHIDGQLHPEFYDTEAAEALRSTGATQASWAQIRPFCLSVIKGKQLPLSFHFVFQLPEAKITELLEDNGLPLKASDIYGLFLNIQFKNNHLTVTTGSSMKIFTMDKSVDQAWDRMVQEFLKIEGLD